MMIIRKAVTLSLGLALMSTPSLGEILKYDQSCAVHSSIMANRGRSVSIGDCVDDGSAIWRIDNLQNHQVKLRFGSLCADHGDVFIAMSDCNFPTTVWIQETLVLPRIKLRAGQQCAVHSAQARPLVTLGSCVGDEAIWNLLPTPPAWVHR